MADAKEEKKGNKMVLILIIMLVLVLAMAGVFGYLFFVKSKTAGQAAPVKMVEVTKSLDDFIINLSDDGPSRTYIKMTMVLAYTDSKLATELEEKTPMIRDIVNQDIRVKYSKDFNGKGLETIRKELIDKINEELDTGKITNIYFSQIIIQ